MRTHNYLGLKPVHKSDRVMGLMATSVLVYMSIISGAIAVPKIRPGRDGVHVGVNLNLEDPAKESQSVAADVSPASNNRSEWWNTELENAIRQGDVETAKQIIKSGIPTSGVNAYTRIPDTPGSRVFYMDFVVGECGFLDVLCDDLDADFYYDHPQSSLTIARLLIEAGYNVNNFDDKTGSGHLYWTDDKIELVELLIQHGIDVDRAGRNGDTPLMTAISFARPPPPPPSQPPSQENRIKVIKLLVNSGANVNARQNGGWNMTPLLHASRRSFIEGMFEAIRFLVSRGAEVNVKTDRYLYTPLHFATQGTRYAHPSQTTLPAVEILVSNGAEVNARDQGGKTPLSWAINAGKHYDNSAIIDFLKNHGGIE